MHSRMGKLSINDFIFLINTYVFEENEKMSKGAIKLKNDLLDFLHKNPIVLDYLMIEKVITPEEALMISMDG